MKIRHISVKMRGDLNSILSESDMIDTEREWNPITAGHMFISSALGTVTDTLNTEPPRKICGFQRTAAIQAMFPAYNGIKSQVKNKTIRYLENIQIFSK